MKKKILVIALCVALLGSVGMNLVTTLPLETSWTEKNERVFKLLDAKRVEVINLLNEKWQLQDKALDSAKRYRQDIWDLKCQISKTEENAEFIEKYHKDQLKSRDEALDKSKDKIKLLEGEIEELRRELSVSFKQLGELRDFKSLAELQRFLLEDDTNELSYELHDWDCEDFAQLLIRNAAEKGLRIHDAWVFHRSGNRIMEWHYFCFAIVRGFTFQGGEKADLAVIVEPETDEFILLGLLDKPEQWRQKIVDILP